MVEITSVKVTAPRKFYKQFQFAVAIDVTFASPAIQIEEITVCFYVDNNPSWCKSDKVYVDETGKHYGTTVTFDAPGTYCFKAIVNDVESNIACTEIIDLTMPSVSYVTPLQADKTAVAVGETVKFYQTAYFDRPIQDVDFEILGEYAKIGMCIYTDTRPEACTESKFEVGKSEYYLEVKYAFKLTGSYRVYSVLGFRGWSIFDGSVTITVGKTGAPQTPQPTPIPTKTTTEEQIPDYIIYILLALLLREVL